MFATVLPVFPDMFATVLPVFPDMFVTVLPVFPDMFATVPPVFLVQSLLKLKSRFYVKTSKKIPLVPILITRIVLTL